MGQVNHALVKYKVYAHGTGTSVVVATPVILYNIHCITATATEDMEIRDGAGGTLILDIKASAAINSNFEFPAGIRLLNGIHITLGSSATGTLRFDYSEV